MHGSSKSMRKGTGTNLPDDNRLREDSSKPEVKYTQRQWDRTVGWGSVPKEYSLADPIWDERWIPKEKEDET